MATSAGAIRAGRAYVEIFADSAALKRSLATARGQLQRFATSIRTIGAAIASPFNAMQQGLSRMGTALTTAGTAFTAFGAIAAAGLGRALGSFGEFDRQMLFVQGVLRETGEDMERLRQRAMDLGRTTSFTAIEVAEGMTELARAGRTTEQIYNEIAGALDLSRGTMTELGRATQYLVSVLNQFGLSSEESTRAADTLAIASSLAVHNFEELGQAMKFTGPIAKVLGFTLEETSAAINLIANNGIRATLAGRQFARVLKELNQPSKRKFLEEMGVQLEMGGEFINIIELFEQLNDSTRFMTKAERFGLFNQLFGIGANVATILTDNTEALGKMNEEIIQGRGYAEQLRKTVESGLWGAFKRLTSAVAGAALEFSAKLAPAISHAMTGITEFVRRIGVFIRESDTLAFTITGIITAFVGVSAAILATGIALRILAAGMTVVGGIAATVFLPLIASIKIVSALISGTLQAAMLALRVSFTALRTVITVVAKGISGLIRLFPLMLQAASVAISGIQIVFGVLAALINTLVVLMTSLGASLPIAIFATMGVLAVGMARGLVRLQKGVSSVTGAFGRLAYQARSAKDAVVATFDGLVQATGQLGRDVVNALGRIDFTRGLRRFTEDFWQVIMSLKQAIMEGDIQGVFEVAVAYMRATWARFLLYLQSTGVQAAFEDIVVAMTTFGLKMGVIFKQGVNWISALAEAMKQLGLRLYNMMRSVFGALPAVIQGPMRLMMKSLEMLFDTSAFPAINVGAKEMEQELKRIDQLAQAQRNRNFMDRHRKRDMLLGQEIAALNELDTATADIQRRAAAREEQAARDRAEAALKREREVQRLRQQQVTQVGQGIQRAMAQATGRSFGAFAGALASQQLWASGFVNLERVAEEQLEQLASINNNTSKPGFVSGTG